VAALIRIDSVWLAVEPLDMRAGTDTALARVVKVFGEARAHHAYLFTNKRTTRVKVLVHDGYGLWLCARRLHRGSFVWARPQAGQTVSLTSEQLQALMVGLPWQRLNELVIHVA
jgi:transposase